MKEKKSYKWRNEFTVVARWYQIRKQYLMALTISLQILVRCFVPKNEHYHNTSFSDFMGNNEHNSLFLEIVIDEDIFHCDYDGINTSLVKSLISPTNIVQHLTYICNKSFESDIFPDEMKIAKIVAFFKNGNHKEFSNYRPVSILPQFSNIHKKLFYNRLVLYVKNNNIMDKSQYEFREATLQD